MMPESRFKDWLMTIDGIIKSFIAIAVGLFTIYIALNDKLSIVFKYFGLEGEALNAITWIVTTFALLFFLFLILRSYSRFASASRLELPDRFTLIASTPDKLIGRVEDLQKLLNCTTRNRIVLLDGESGCGKSALVAAGLVPILLSRQGLLPVLIRDWGDDWIKGPLCSSLEALFDILTPEQRALVGWSQSPDLAADTPLLLGEFKSKFNDITVRLGRRPLLICDQFDDYQAQHLGLFLDADGNWVKSDVLIQINPFWNLVKQQLMAESLHLLVVTRADTASGLSCLRFFDASKIADRHLPRIELEYIRQILEYIAPSDENPPVVSQPAHGWFDLRDLLEFELRLGGSILMQQLKTILIGLRQLPVLTINAYRRAGELKGLESLVIKRAIRRASDAVAGDYAHEKIARQMLAELVLPGDMNQPPKAQRVLFSKLASIAGDEVTAKLMLCALQADNIVRPAEGVGRENSWQLDHDYLAVAVLTESKLACRWSIVLQTGLNRFLEAKGNWKKRWSSLLPISVQARIFWERARGRLRYGDAVSYARLSLIKPALCLLLISIVFSSAEAWHQNYLVEINAQKIFDGFGSSNEKLAVINSWRASKDVRGSLYKFINDNPDRLYKAVRSPWPLAHGGLESEYLLQSVKMLREQMLSETDLDVQTSLVKNYELLASRIPPTTDIKVEAEVLLNQLTSEKNADKMQILAYAYASVVVKLQDQTDIIGAATVIHELLSRDLELDTEKKLVKAYTELAVKFTNPTHIEKSIEIIGSNFSDSALTFSNAYWVLALKINNQSIIERQVDIMRKFLADEKKPYVGLTIFYDIFAILVNKITTPSLLKKEIESMRLVFLKTCDEKYSKHLSEIYSFSISRLTENSVIKSEIENLRNNIITSNKSECIAVITEAYAKLVIKLTDHSIIENEIESIHKQISASFNTDRLEYLYKAYSAVATKLTAPVEIKQAAETLRTILSNEYYSYTRWSTAELYLSVAEKLTENSAINNEVNSLRRLILASPSDEDIWPLTEAYIGMVAKIKEPRVIRYEVETLHQHMLDSTNRKKLEILTRAYSNVAIMLNDQSFIQMEAVQLRNQIFTSTHSDIKSLLAEAYASVVDNLSDATFVKQEAALIRKQIVAPSSHENILPLVYIYAALATNFTDPIDIEQATEILYNQLIDPANHENIETLADIYSVVTVAHTNSNDIKKAVETLRNKCLSMTGTEDSTAVSVCISYGQVAAALTDAKDIQFENETWRNHIFEKTSLDSRDQYIQMYTFLLEYAIDGNSNNSLEPWLREILVIAGHPYLEDASSFLSILEPIAGQSFGSSIGAAVSWWTKEYKGDPATLRLPPR